MKRIIIRCKGIQTFIVLKARAIRLTFDENEVNF